MDSDAVRNAYTFTIAGRRPPNLQAFYSGIHWGQRADLVRDWRQIVQMSMREAGIKKTLLTDCKITVTAKMKGSRIDPSNLCAKVIEDGMKRYQTIRKKVLRPAKVGNKPVMIGKVQVEELENERYLFKDDCWPFVVSVTTAVVPADSDEIVVLVDGLPDR